MRNTYLDKITYTAFSRSEPMVLSLFFFLTGIASGASFSAIMSPQERSDILSFINGYFSETEAITYPSPFFHSVALNILLLALIAFSGRFAFGFFTCFLALIGKGMTLGFVCGLFLKCFKLQGLLWIITTVLPQNILVIPAFIVAGIFSISGSFGIVGRLKRGEKKKAPLDEAGPYILIYSFLCVIIILAGVIESFLFPIVL